MDGTLSGVALIEGEKERKRLMNVDVEATMAGDLDGMIVRDSAGID